jgi:riboflavin synthase
MRWSNSGGTVFTGIIEGLGRVRSLNGGVLILDVVRGFEIGAWKLGESVAVNGCCLTVVDFSNGLRFDLSGETLKRTSLGSLAVGSRVNLERAMRADGRFGGHIVQGHVDATGAVESITSNENSTVFRFSAPRDCDRYLIDKGSITIDGVSLTVVEPSKGKFGVWVIPHSLQETNLGERKVGDNVNLEFDVIAKYVERMTQSS